MVFVPPWMELLLWTWAAAAAAHWAFTFWLTWHGRKLFLFLEPGGPPPGKTPPVRVLVAARDEERDVGDCLRSVLAQDYPDLGVVLADDGSTDATREIAEDLARGDPRLRVIEAGDLPEGWAGKPHALHRAWREARPGKDGLLLFTDADVHFGPGVVREAVGAMERLGVDLLSLIPRMVNRGFWEKVLQPAVGNLIVLGGIAGTLGRPERQVRLAAGAFLLVRARAYRAAGGHRAIRDQIVDDVALATSVFRRGGKTVAMVAPGLLSVRMYRGLREIWRGWAKNMFAGHMDSLAWAALTGAGLLVASVAPPFLAVAALAAGRPWLGAAFVAVTGVGMTYRAVANVMVGERAWPALLHPLAAAVICAILAQSTWQRRFGSGALWRGRRYPLRGSS